MDIEWWKAFFEVGGVVLLFLTFAFGAGFMMTSKKVNERQAERLREFDSDLTSAKSQLAVQQERAATADSRVAGLEKDAADAKAELAKQQTTAATAEKSLLELQERIKPRRLTDKQALAFVEALKTIHGGTIDFGYTSGGGDEGFNFAKEFLPLFKQAAWTVRNEASIANHLDIQVIGVGIVTSVPAGPNPALPPSGYIELTPALMTLRTAFRTIGIEVQFISWFPGKTAPEIVIGSKPEPTP